MAQRGGYSLQELVDAASAAERLPASERVVGGYLAQGLLPPPRAAGAHTLFEDEHLIRLRLLLRLTAQYVPLPEAGRWLSALAPTQVLAVLDRPQLPRSPGEGDAQAYLTRLLSGTAQGAGPPPPPASLAVSAPRVRRGQRATPLPASVPVSRSQWLHIGVDPDVQLMVRAGSARLNAATIERMIAALQRCLDERRDAE